MSTYWKSIDVIDSPFGLMVLQQKYTTDIEGRMKPAKNDDYEHQHRLVPLTDLEGVSFHE